MDFKRSLCSVRMIFITAGLAVTVAASSWEMIRDCFTNGADYSAVDMLGMSMIMDKFKVLMVILTAGIYTTGFCHDFRYHYLRMILTRTDVFSYCVSKFITNTISIIVSCLLAFYMFAGLIACFGISISSNAGTITYYYQMAYRNPILYIGMMALQFGMVCAACCGIGVLLSAFQPNAFVCIGFSGMVFFGAVSYIPLGNPFDVFNLVCMRPTLLSGSDTPEALMFLWGMLYPISIVIVCTYLFYRRMKWREENGFL